MRIVAILICLGGIVAAAWHLAVLGTDRHMLRGAPQIEKFVDEGVRASVLPIATHPIEIRTSGRDVRLSGPVNSDAERQEILNAARRTRFMDDLDDALRVLPTAAPYLFQAIKKEDGGIVLIGNVPTAQIHEDLLAKAREHAEGAVVSDRLILSAGVPEGDWSGMVGVGMSALAELRDGQVQISDTQALITGNATDADAAQQLMAAVNAAPLGDWQVQINGALPVVEDYAFSVMKIEDGSLILNGNAPDQATRDALLAAARSASSKQVSGEIRLADGMPAADWPESVMAGIAALQSSTSGLFEVIGNSVSLSAEVDSDDDLALLLPLLEDAWTTQIAVRNPTPEAVLKLSLAADGGLSANGLLPEGMDIADLAAALPRLDLGQMDMQARGRPADWLAPLAGLQIVLPRFETASAELVGTNLALRGKLKRGFSADGAEAALKSALDRDWTLDLDLTESAPLAELILSKQDQNIAISGVLPFGLDALDALELLGETASGEGVSGGGEGDPQAWAEALEAGQLALARFAQATGRISERQIELNGLLLPGYPASDLQDWMGPRMPEDWSLILSADEIAPSEGDQRVSLATGEAQNFRQGYWLPNVDFTVSTQQCGLEIDRALADETIVFVTGSARIDQQGRILLNRLAAVAVRCLNSSGLRLQISGHTDSVGNDENNLILSQERADAVRAALLDRGVKADAVEAVGHGEAQPITTNDTAEGRAQNRRIDFGWSEGAE